MDIIAFLSYYFERLHANIIHPKEKNVNIFIVARM